MLARQTRPNSTAVPECTMAIMAANPTVAKAPTTYGVRLEDRIRCPAALVEDVIVATGRGREGEPDRPGDRVDHPLDFDPDRCRDDLRNVPRVVLGLVDRL